MQGGFHSLGWRLDILPRRVICWLSQAPFVLLDADARFYRRFLRSLSRQVRYLRRSLKATRAGYPRLQALIALNYATLCMHDSPARCAARRAAADGGLRYQILPDGGHISRNPGRADRIAGRTCCRCGNCSRRASCSRRRRSTTPSTA